jgi:hypothetical protein
MQSYLMLKQVVHIVTNGLWEINKIYDLEM